MFLIVIVDPVNIQEHAGYGGTVEAHIADIIHTTPVLLFLTHALVHSCSLLSYINLSV